MKKQTVPPHYVDREVITISENGVWTADGSEITHQPTLKLFNKSLKKDEEGYYLEIGRESKRIQVKDTAYFVHRVEGNPQEGYWLILNDETREKLKPETLSYRPGRLSCLIKNEEETAKFLHIPYFDILKHLKENKKEYYLEFGTQNSLRKIVLSTKQSTPY